MWACSRTMLWFISNLCFKYAPKWTVPSFIFQTVSWEGARGSTRLLPPQPIPSFFRVTLLVQACPSISLLTKRMSILRIEEPSFIQITFLFLNLANKFIALHFGPFSIPSNMSNGNIRPSAWRWKDSWDKRERGRDCEVQRSCLGTVAP